MRTDMYFVYILQSKLDWKLYVGMTKDVEKRLAYHNSGRVRSTKSRIPFRMLYSEHFETKADARKREVYLKSYKGSQEKAAIVTSAITALSSNG